jgi:hypothetical protein
VVIRVRILAGEQYLYWFDVCNFYSHGLMLQLFPTVAVRQAAWLAGRLVNMGLSFQPRTESKEYLLG